MNSALGQIAAHAVPTAAAGKRRLAVIGAGLLVLALAAAISVATFRGSQLAGAAVDRAKSLLELIDQRSPGERTQSDLVKTKHRFPRMHERALAKVRHAPPSVVPPVTLVDIVFPPPSPVLVASDKPIPLIGETIPPPGGPGVPPLVFPAPIPPSQTPPTSLPPVVGQPTPPPTPAVPEPATWLTMLLGFALIGWKIQQRTSRCRLEAC